MRYHFHPFSPNCRKTTAMLNSIDFDVERKVVDLPKGEQFSREYLAINPNGMIPALEDGDTTVIESNAILIYLAEKTGSPLWPAERSRQLEILQWMFWEQSHFLFATGTVFYNRLIKPMIGETADEKRVDEALNKFRRHAKVLNEHLEKRSFLLGDHLSLADWAVASHLSLAEAIRLPLSELPNVETWLAALDSNEAWKASAPQA